MSASSRRQIISKGNQIVREQMLSRKKKCGVQYESQEVLYDFVEDLSGNGNFVTPAADSKVENHTQTHQLRRERRLPSKKISGNVVTAVVDDHRPHETKETSSNHVADHKKLGTKESSSNHVADHKKLGTKESSSCDVSDHKRLGTKQILSNDIGDYKKLASNKTSLNAQQQATGLTNSKLIFISMESGDTDNNNLLLDRQNLTDGGSMKSVSSAKPVTTLGSTSTVTNPGHGVIILDNVHTVPQTLTEETSL